MENENAFKQPENAITLEDQKILRDMGISGMPSGLEFMLREMEQARASAADLEKRADGLQSLALDERTLQKLAEERGCSVEEVRREFQMYRDLPGEQLPDWLDRF